jgi:hypothetical protein
MSAQQNHLVGFHSLLVGGSIAFPNANKKPVRANIMSTRRQVFLLSQRLGIAEGGEFATLSLNRIIIVQLLPCV